MQDRIKRMAVEAGFKVDGDSWIHSPDVILMDGRKSVDKYLKRFARLVAEDCARVCDERYAECLEPEAMEMARDIRARYAETKEG